MSEPARLQDRLKAEFADGLEGGEEAGGDHRDRVSDVAGQSPILSHTYLHHDALTVVVAGLALLSAVLALITGVLQGFYVAAFGMAVAGTAAGLLLVRSRQHAEQRMRNHAESHHDRAWEHNETAVVAAAIHDILRDIVLVRSLDGRIIRANSVLSDIVGIADPAGQNCADIGLDIHAQPLPHHYDVQIVTPGGPRIYAWHDITIRDPSSGDLTIHSIARDVTEDRRAENLRETARRKAELESEAKSRLLATVSHEIRTPLSGILGMSHLIGQTRLTEEQKNYLAGMRQSGHALVQLVDDLLDFSSIEAGRFQLRPSEEPVRQLIEGVVEMLSPRAHEKGLEIGSFVSADVPPVMLLDGPRLRQVLYNVVGNAVKFTQAGGIYLETSMEGDFLVLSVRDTGAGMTAEERTRVFEAFEQGGCASQRQGGTGLGLAISARILREAGGALDVVSTAGEGTTFVIRMPATATLAATGSRARPLEGADVFLYAPNGPVASALVRTIDTLGGACRHAATLAEALEFVQGDAVRLTDVIVDNRFSGEFRRELADAPVFADRRVRRIYLVNPEERTGRAIGNGEGYDAWLIRPLRERSLIEVLRGRLKGIEIRDAINDNRPNLREPPLQEVPDRPKPAGRVLLAEDDPVNAMLVRSMLTKAGFVVQTVDDFPAVVAALADLRHRPDLLITDLGMPGGDGRQVVREIASKRDAPPVIVLTAERGLGLHEEMMACGAACVLEKPADLQALLTEAFRLIKAASRA